MTSVLLWHILLFVHVLASPYSEDSASERLKMGKDAYGRFQYKEAIDQLSEAIRLDPTNAEAFYYRGLALSKDFVQEKQFLADFSEAIRLNPKYRDAYRERGWQCCRSMGNDKALQDLTEAIRLDAKDSRAYWMRGYIAYEAKQYKNAIADCETAIKLDPKEHAVYALLATMQACCPEKVHRDGKAAVGNAKKAYDLNPWHMSMDALAASFAEYGQFDEATKWQKRAIEDIKKQKSGGGLFKEIYEKHLGLYEQRMPLRLRSLRVREGDR